MKYAIFSDIHANLEAYEAVLAAIKKEGVDAYYCGGDIVGYGADPTACIDMTQELGCETVVGNHDWAAVDMLDTTYFNQYAKAAVLWTATQLREKDEEYLKKLELVSQNDFSVVHGSLNRPEEFGYIFDFPAAHKSFLLLAENSKSICFIGHSHSAGVFMEEGDGEICFISSPDFTVKDDKRYIVNVGSVGQPRDGDPRATYCIYDADNKSIAIKRISYDVKRAQDKIIKAGLPHMLAERLGVGR